MTDRELLELAAKAAGYKIVGNFGLGLPKGGGLVLDSGSAIFGVWNPLEDDGDALRLAVKLHISVDFDGALVEMQVKDDNAWASEFAHDGDLYAATRRAIVRAAAEIGRGWRKSNE